MPVPSVTAFIEGLRRLPILEPAQLQELTDTLANQFPGPKALAKELNRRGWLTAYQAGELLEDRGEGLVLGQYLLLEPLGQGGMGQVFKARHRGLNRLVAVKVLRPERVCRSDAARRFHREIQVAAQLSHPNIVLAYDADQVGDKIFFAMEYVEGVDLQQMVQQSGPVPVSLACDYIRQAALGLQHALERGLVHRDIKPPNLLVTVVSGPSGKQADNSSMTDVLGEVPSSGQLKSPSGRSRKHLVKILDLGLSRLKWTSETEEASGFLTQEGVVFGTADFIAPEQATDSHRVDIRADLYSLGCTFYYLLAGQVPFPGGTILEKLFKHQNAKPQPLAALREEVPPEVTAIVAKLMAKRPEDRYQTPAELATALARMLETISVPAGAGAAGTLQTTAPARPAVADAAAPAVQAPTRTAEDTSDSLTGWAAIVQPPARATPPLALRENPVPPTRRWLWLAGGGVGLGMALLALLLVLLNRPVKPSPSTNAAPSQAAKTSAANDPRRVGTAAGQATSLTVLVEANRPWQDTGVEVQAGRPVTISARGDWLRGSTSCSADGLPAEPRDRNVLSGARALCLLGRVGGNTTPIALGASKKLVPRQGGRLFVQANTLDLHENAGRLQLEIQGGIPSTDPAAPPGPTRVEAAEAVLKPLLTQAAEPKTDSEALRRSLWGLCFAFPGTPQAARAAEMLRQFPSLLDKLDPGRIPADERFAWQPKELVAVLGEHRQRHWGAVLSVAVSHDGKVVASSGDDAVIRLWNTATGREQVMLKGHSGPVSAVEFTSDGRTLISVSGLWNQPSEIRLWDVIKAEESAIVRGFSNVLLSPDGMTLATRSDDGTVKLWDRITGKERATLKGHTAAVSVVAVSSDGKTVATGSADLTVKVWDVTTGKERHTLKGHTAAVNSLAFTADGQGLASAGSDGTIKVWNVATGQEEATLRGHTGAVNALAFSPDGESLASGCVDRTVRLWDRGKHQARAILQGHTAAVTSIVFTADGKTLASGSVDRTVRLWDVAVETESATVNGHEKATTGQEIHPLQGNFGPALSVAFAPDGSTLASGLGDGTVKLWDMSAISQRGTLAPHRTLQGHTDEILAVAYAPDGKALISASRDKTARLWELATPVGAAGALAPRVNLQGHNEAVWTVAFSPDGRAIATGSGDRTVQLWDSAAGQTFGALQEQGLIVASTYGSDGKAVSVPSAEQSVRLWEVVAGQSGFSFEGDAPPGLSWVIATDGRTVVSRGEEKSLKLWEAATRTERATLPGHTGLVLSAAFAPDGKTLATGSDDQSIKLWDVGTGTERLAVPGNNGPVSFVRFTPDGKKLITTGDNGRALLVWDAASANKLMEWKLPGLVHGIAFAPDGRHLATANGNGTVYVLRLGTASATSK
jgi:WD40 repeat protein/serine/threonine protein kinase